MYKARNWKDGIKELEQTSSRLEEIMYGENLTDKEITSIQKELRERSHKLKQFGAVNKVVADMLNAFNGYVSERRTNSADANNMDVYLIKHFSQITVERFEKIIESTIRDKDFAVIGALEEKYKRENMSEDDLLMGKNKIKDKRYFSKITIIERFGYELNLAVSKTLGQESQVEK